MGSNENAAQKRVERAVEKLRAFFRKRELLVPAATLTTALASQCVQAVPAELISSVATAAISKGATVTTSTLTLVNGILKLMTWSQLKTAAAVIAVLLLVGAITGIVLTNRARPVVAPEVNPLERPVVVVTPSLRYPNDLQAGPVDTRANAVTTSLWFANNTPADRSTPKGCLLVITKAMETGDQLKFVESFTLSSEEERASRKTLERLVTTAFIFRKAMGDKFGRESANGAFLTLPLGIMPRRVIESAEEKIAGDSATVDVHKGGQLVQLMKVNGEWKATVEGLFNSKAAFLGGYCSRLIKALEEATPELPQGKYTTAMDAVNAVEQKSQVTR